MSDAREQKTNGKCANPSCATAFDPLAGGEVFRFALERAGDGNRVERIALPGTAHHVRQYWLCRECASVLRLSFDNDRGVVFGLRWPEQPAQFPSPDRETGMGECDGDASDGSSPIAGETRA